VRPDFCLVHEDVAEEFIQKMKETVREFYGADASKTEWFGRVINTKAYERLADLVEKGRDAISFGGSVDASQRYVEPTLFDFGSDLANFRAQPIMQDEIFGPLFPLARFKNIEEVVSFSRNLPTGKPLACYCYARDQAVIDAVSKRTLSGGLCINDNIMHLANHDLPFGGVGESGMGNYHGEYSFKTFTHEKAVLRKYPVVDELPVMKQLLGARFPGYTDFKKLVIKLFSMHFAGVAVNPPVAAMVRFVKQLIILILVLKVTGHTDTFKRLL